MFLFVTHSLPQSVSQKSYIFYISFFLTKKRFFVYNFFPINRFLPANNIYFLNSTNNFGTNGQPPKM